jgi:hypothetical protein
MTLLSGTDRGRRSEDEMAMCRRTRYCSHRCISDSHRSAARKIGRHDFLNPFFVEHETQSSMTGLLALLVETVAFLESCPCYCVYVTTVSVEVWHG